MVINKSSYYWNNFLNRSLSSNDALTKIEDRASVENQIENKEKKEIVNSALESLPEKYRLVLLMRHLEEMNYSEIGEVFGWSLGTVKTRIHKGRKLLRKILEKYYA